MRHFKAAEHYFAHFAPNFAAKLSKYPEAPRIVSTNSGKDV